MHTDRTNRGLAIVGAAITIGFFLPWIDLGGVAAVSGWDLARQEQLSAITRALLMLCPVLGAALVLSAVVRPAAAAGTALAAGGAILAYTTYKVGYGFIKITGVGLWMVLAGAAVALVAGLAARANRG